MCCRSLSTAKAAPCRPTWRRDASAGIGAASRWVRAAGRMGTTAGHGTCAAASYHQQLGQPCQCLPCGRCGQVALDVARGLAFMHGRRLVHFDLKSANILLDK